MQKRLKKRVGLFFHRAGVKFSVPNPTFSSFPRPTPHRLYFASSTPLSRPWLPLPHTMVLSPPLFPSPNFHSTLISANLFILLSHIFFREQELPLPFPTASNYMSDPRREKTRKMMQIYEKVLMRNWMKYRNAMHDVDGTGVEEEIFLLVTTMVRVCGLGCVECFCCLVSILRLFFILFPLVFISGSLLRSLTFYYKHTLILSHSQRDYLLAACGGAHTMTISSPHPKHTVIDFFTTSSSSLSTTILPHPTGY